MQVQLASTDTDTPCISAAASPGVVGSANALVGAAPAAMGTGDGVMLASITSGQNVGGPTTQPQQHVSVEGDRIQALDHNVANNPAATSAPAGTSGE